MAKDKGGGLTDAAKKLGHAGGLKGGPARKKALPAAQRKQIAREGGLAKARKKRRGGL